MDDSTKVDENYVRATCSYKYCHKGKDVQMVKDEIFLLIKKTTDDWWQVIRNGETKPFYAPSKYLIIAQRNVDPTKSSLRKKIAHQRQLQIEQQKLQNELLSKNVNVEKFITEPNQVAAETLYSKNNNASNHHIPNSNYEITDSLELSNFRNSFKKLSAAKNIEPRKTLSSFSREIEVIEPPQAFLDRSKNERSSQERFGISYAKTNSPDEKLDDFDSSFNKSLDSYDESFDSIDDSAHVESFSTNTSRSSLNISHGSVDSYIKSHPSSSVSKSASFDAIKSNCQSRNSYSSDYAKAASTEEIDKKMRKGEHFPFQSNLRNSKSRSNSVDLKRFDNKFDLSDCEKVVSLEKRKSRITKDPMNRRRSWALNEPCMLLGFSKNHYFECENFDDLEKPPSLPPKMKKGSYKPILNSASTENLARINEDFDHANRPILPEKSQKVPPIAYPRKVIPLSQGECDVGECLDDNKLYTRDKLTVDEPLTICWSRSSLKQPSGKIRNQDQKFEIEKCVQEQKVIPDEKVINEKQNAEAKFNGWKKVQNLVTGVGNKKELKSIRDKFDRNNWVKECDSITAIKLHSRDGWSVKDEVEALKERSVEQLIERMENKTKMNELKEKSNVTVLHSPKDAPKRILFDDWGEYIDKDSDRPFYFNIRTHEKRWKPPRKSVTATSPSISSENSPKSVKSSPNLMPPLTISHSPTSTLSSIKTNLDTSLHSKLVCSQTLNADSSKKFSSDVSSTLPQSKKVFSGTNTLPENLTVDVSGGISKIDNNKSPQNKSSKSFFSSFSNFSFIKHSSSSNEYSNQSHNSLHSKSISKANIQHLDDQSAMILQKVDKSAKSKTPPKSSQYQKSSKLLHSYSSGHIPTKVLPGKKSTTSLVPVEEQQTLHRALENFHVPKGWVRKFDALSHQVYFESSITGEKWTPAIDQSGRVYVYSATGGQSKWNLQEYEDLNSPTSPLPPLKEVASVIEDALLWRFVSKEGKKCRKNWTSSYARYFPMVKKTEDGKMYGSITFSKKQNDSKKMDSFDLVPQCYIDSHLKKPNCFCLRNGANTEVILQGETPAIATEWTKLLFQHDKVQEKILSVEKEKKTTTKSTDKGQSKAPDDATKGIKDTLMLFFKRRIQQETLAKKGIYKDTVFGSTIDDICQKEQLNTPVFVLRVIRNIEKNEENFKVDGLYRISGNASRIQKIRIEAGQNRYGILDEEKDVHNLSGALKLFFRELKEPLIPFANYDSFIRSTDYLKNENRGEALKNAVKKLPICNRETLKILLEHLLKLNEYESENRMSIMNLAIVFGPCLMWPETTSGFDLMTDAMLHNRVVEALLSEFEIVFNKR